jgi:hypothetical protein
MMADSMLWRLAAAPNVHLGLGNGNFQSPLPPAITPHFLAVADFNGMEP